MKYNKEHSCEDILNANKNKYLFIGFIIGIMPFILLISVLSFKEGGIQSIPSVLIQTLLFFGILTAIANSIILKNIITKKIKTSFY